MTSGFRRFIFKIARIALVVAIMVLFYNAWQAVIEDAGPNRLIVPLQLEQKGEAQLFYDRGNGLREADSVRVEVGASAELQEVVFPVPRVPLRELRFDPFSGAGKFMIGPPRLESASGRVIAKFSLAAVVPRNQVVPLQPAGEAWSGSTTPGADDPQLTFGLGTPLRTGRARLPWPETAVAAALLLFSDWVKPREPPGSAPGAGGSV